METGIQRLDFPQPAHIPALNTAPFDFFRRRPAPNRASRRGAYRYL
jgi:hypothetical protein